MQHVPGDLVRRLAELADRFAHVSAELAHAGRGLAERRALPPGTLVDELAALHADLEDARLRVQELAAALGVRAAAPPAGLRDLEALLRAAADTLRRRAEAEARRQVEQEEARRRAEAEARRRAEERARREAEEAARRQAEERVGQRASEARPRPAESAQRRPEPATGREEQAHQRPAGEARLKSVEGPRGDGEAPRREADGPPPAELEPRRAGGADPESRLEAPGQPTAAATARRPAAGTTGDSQDGARREREEDSPPGPGDRTPRRAEVVARAAARPGVPAEEQASSASPGPRPPATAPPHELPPPVASHAAPGVGPGPAPQRSDAGDLGIETAQWWIAATAAWASLRSRRMTLADAVREALAKYPYVFSVPIETSADYEDGLLAYGYAVVIDYLEAAVPGFVGEALQRLPGVPASPLGRRLYEYLGERLRPRYPGFVRAVLEAALPRVTPWLSGSVEETETATTVMLRPGPRPGDPHQRLERLVSEVERLRDHRFVLPLAPLTMRVVRVEAPELREPREVDIHLTVQGVPSDQAWIATVAGREGTGVSVRRHDPRGTVLVGLGRELTALWVAVYHPGPDGERQLELTVRVRRRSPSSVFRRPR